jgi:hypothetical protein
MSRTSSPTNGVRVVFFPESREGRAANRQRHSALERIAWRRLGLTRRSSESASRFIVVSIRSLARRPHQHTLSPLSRTTTWWHSAPQLRCLNSRPNAYLFTLKHHHPLALLPTPPAPFVTARTYPRSSEDPSSLASFAVGHHTPISDADANEVTLR